MFRYNITLRIAGHRRAVSIPDSCTSPPSLATQRLVTDFAWRAAFVRSQMASTLKRRHCLKNASHCGLGTFPLIKAALVAFFPDWHAPPRI
jgi:hypothetical protein